jgi:hypothetical protein
MEGFVMISIHGTYQHGSIVLDEPVSLPEGTHVRVTLDPTEKPAAGDTCVDGTPWDDSPEGTRAWLEWFDAQTPILNEEEYQKWEAGRLGEKNYQKQLAARAEQPRGMALHG